MAGTRKYPEAGSRGISRRARPGLQGYLAHSYRVMAGTREYRSPETVLQLPWDTPADIWAVGTYTLHPTPYTLHPTPYTLHPTPYTLHPTPYTLHLIVSISNSNKKVDDLMRRLTF